MEMDHNEQKYYSANDTTEYNGRLKGTHSTHTSICVREKIRKSYNQYYFTVAPHGLDNRTLLHAVNSVKKCQNHYYFSIPDGKISFPAKYDKKRRRNHSGPIWNSSHDENMQRQFVGNSRKRAARLANQQSK